MGRRELSSTSSKCAWLHTKIPRRNLRAAVAFDDRRSFYSSSTFIVRTVVALHEWHV
jgi:hypothetical protein